MTSVRKTIGFLFAFLCLITFSSCQDYPSVSLYANQKIDFALTIGEVSEIIKSFGTNEKIAGFWSYVDKGVWNGYITITGFNLSVAFNDQHVIPSEVSDGIYINGNDSITLTVVASFEARTSILTHPSGIVTFKVLSSINNSSPPLTGSLLSTLARTTRK
jgi:hypothetical protein